MAVATDCRNKDLQGAYWAQHHALHHANAVLAQRSKENKDATAENTILTQHMVKIKERSKKMKTAVAASRDALLASAAAFQVVKDELDQVEKQRDMFMKEKELWQRQAGHAKRNAVENFNRVNQALQQQRLQNEKLQKENAELTAANAALVTLTHSQDKKVVHLHSLVAPPPAARKRLDLLHQ